MRGETPVSVNEQNFVLAALAQGHRVDGRTVDAFRRVRVRVGPR